MNPERELFLYKIFIIIPEYTTNNTAIHRNKMIIGYSTPGLIQRDKAGLDNRWS
jgi:hypothetical protein